MPLDKAKGIYFQPQETINYNMKLYILKIIY